MDWQSAELSDSKGLKIPDRWLHLYYYEALNILFRFENALRIFVYVILKRELGKDWDLAAVSDGATIRTETRKRIAQAREHGYLGDEVTSPVLYLNSGELTQILISDAYWRYFAGYFKATKAVVLTKLQEIGTVRNSLAHFRPVKQDDVDLIKQNSKHVLLEIERCLIQISTIANVVPTNSTEPWYKELKSIGSKHLTTSLYFSRDQEWVRIELIYPIATLVKNLYGEHFCSFKVTNLQTLQLLRQYQAIRDNCIYVSEDQISAQFNDDFSIAAYKPVSIILAKKTLNKVYEDISTAIRDIAVKVESETALLLEDNLACGELIDSQTGHAIPREGQDSNKYWSFSMDNLKTSVSGIEEVEFWGQRSHYHDDFVAATARYPWMPSTVSKPNWFD
ncbi:hypothetical protein [Geothrix campi]|uniref:hypothetical protein n=1 Tax=Geothrix campi TaxID=2966450 RepID=UPI002147BD97|nr:hypothetical protein [Geothrix sp. SG10]